MKSIEFAGSFPSLLKCPKVFKPEYAFIGRSNVGKSSLINMLMKRHNFAHVSKKPGKTQMINYFLIDQAWYLVDLPGYGYAKVSKKLRVEWEDMVKRYLRNRISMQCAFVLVDGSVPVQEVDLEFIGWMGEMQIPFTLVYTKLDKVREEEQKENIESIQQALLKDWSALPQQFYTSAETQLGRQELLSFIMDVNQAYEQANAR